MAAAPASSILFKLSIFVTKLLAPIITGFFNSIPQYFVFKSAMIIYIYLFSLVSITYNMTRAVKISDSKCIKIFLWDIVPYPYLNSF
jgi:hypothetical protein